MLAGKLNKRIKLQRPVADRDGVGGSVPRFTTYATVWAGIKPMTGKEAEQARQVVATVTHKITIRFHPLVEASHRVEFKGRPFDINAVLNIDERKQQLQLLCTEAA